MEEFQDNKPVVSIVIPCLNEEKYIKECLSSLEKQDYPKERLEVFFMDGMSEDRTVEIIKEEMVKHPWIKVFKNKDKFTPFAFNLGIKNSKGKVIIFLGAHATYEKDYVSKCVRYLKECKADNVGGIEKVVPKENTLVAKAIAVSLSYSFGAGNAPYRTGSKEPREVDTVFGGCYRKEVFNKIGFFNEKLFRSQDMELNMRLKKAGGKIMLIPDIIVRYHPKSDLIGFWKHNILDGVWAIYPLKFVKTPLKLRHLLPFIFVLSLISLLIAGFFCPSCFKLFLGIILLYLAVNLYFSFSVSLKEKDLRYFFILPLVFAVRHFGYGLGSLLGLIKIFKD